MIIYVETNFVLELALNQEQKDSCENILALCETGDASLIIPAFSIAEPYETLIRRAKNREVLKRELTNEIRQLSRSDHYKNKMNDLQNITTILIQSIDEERKRLNQTLVRILRLAETIPVGQRILSSATKFQQTLALSPQDSIVYASVIEHLHAFTVERKCFLNRNLRDFNDPDIVDELSTFNCKILFNFVDGYQYISSQTP